MSKFRAGAWGRAMRLCMGARSPVTRAGAWQLPITGITSVDNAPRLVGWEAPALASRTCTTPSKTITLSLDRTGRKPAVGAVFQRTHAWQPHGDSWSARNKFRSQQQVFDHIQL
ncbi:hypothetical protein C0Q70_13813 [Pomacea canaliculata]|uniref:Uncharacterized protein n=1 Tax=Pomacea canaliculata TaxID=400727 RepID=A0A2T7NYB4_POMCA|nr:hypothetical protein C0Q70_13813 [Pomacea canaliculata]